VMNEVYKAMQALKCVWHQVNNYRVLCLWKYTSGIVPKPIPSPTVKNVSMPVLLQACEDVFIVPIRRDSSAKLVTFCVLCCFVMHILLPL
jgi:hypothetical protein